VAQAVARYAQNPGRLQLIASGEAQDSSEQLPLHHG
jgi:hypothetical protein